MKLDVLWSRDFKIRRQSMIATDTASVYDRCSTEHSMIGAGHPRVGHAAVLAVHCSSHLTCHGPD